MKWRYPKNLLRPVQSIEVPKYRLSWKPAPSKLKNAPPFLAPFGFRPKTLPAQLVFRSLEFGFIRTNIFKLPDGVCQLELSACEDGLCESPSVNQSAINFISGHGTSEIISPEPDKVLVCYADINTITTKKKWRYATQTAAKKKEYAENHKRARAKEKGAYKEIVPKQAEETKWLKTLVTELERTTVLLTQPAPVTARSTYLKSYILKEHARLSSKLKRKKRNEKSSRQYFNMQRRVLSFCAQKMNSKS